MTMYFIIASEAESKQLCHKQLLAMRTNGYSKSGLKKTTRYLTLSYWHTTTLSESNKSVGSSSLTSSAEFNGSWKQKKTNEGEV